MDTYLSSGVKRTAGFEHNLIDGPCGIDKTKLWHEQPRQTLDQNRMDCLCLYLLNVKKRRH
jgi:hypothetical protein